jgi:hypothetical protein
MSMIQKGALAVLTGTLAVTDCTISVSAPIINDAGTPPGSGSGGPANGSSGGSSGGSGGPGPTDASGSGATDAAIRTLGFKPSNIPTSADLVPAGDLVFNTHTCDGTRGKIDTSNGMVSCGPNGLFTTGKMNYAKITQSDQSFGALPTALFVTNHFTVETGMVVEVVGNLPLIIVAFDDANISGVLQAIPAPTYDQGVAGGQSGPGMGGTAGLGPGGGRPSTISGGAGGAGFCGVGGDGGGNTGSGGKAYGHTNNIPLLAGSSGASGMYGTGGAGGGAVQIVSATTIEVTGLGTINVGGAGPRWSRNGGGSGGAILLEAPSVHIVGTLAANGGGGAEADINNGGQNAQASATPAAGGASTEPFRSSGGNGGAGVSIDGASSLTPTATNGEGGGGGGAVGRIRINVMHGNPNFDSNSIVSPALTTPCATQGTLSL